MDISKKRFEMYVSNMKRRRVCFPMKTGDFFRRKKILHHIRAYVKPKKIVRNNNDNWKHVKARPKTWNA